MFTARLRGTSMTYTVYAVDFNHDAFLIGKDGRFVWKPMDDFVPVI